MTSTKQIAANRNNARKSTGPRTDVGKAIAKLNAVKHGGLSPLPVLPEVETRDEWDAHLVGTLASLNPVGQLETVLAERVALILWRMNRVAKFEREMIAVGQERVVDDLADEREDRLSYRKVGPDHPDDVRAYLRDARRSLDVMLAVSNRPDETGMSGEEAELVLSTVADQTEHVDSETFSMPEVVPDEIPWGEFTEWTAGRIRQGIAAMAEAEGTSPESLLAGALQHFSAEVIKLKAESEKIATAIHQLRRERLLGNAPQTDRVMRYEAHLSRQLAQALHELQRLQAARAGAPVPPPAVLDVTVGGLE